MLDYKARVDAVKSLRRIARLPANWDSYGADPPNDTAVHAAEDVLQLLAQIDFGPTRVDPSAEGGVCLSSQAGNRYGDIECFNTGEVLAVISKGGDDTAVWSVDTGEVNAAANRIRAFVNR